MLPNEWLVGMARPGYSGHCNMRSVTPRTPQGLASQGLGEPWVEG
jgi:hypothetical protein